MSRHLGLYNSQLATGIGFAWNLLYFYVLLGLQANKMLPKIIELCEA